MKKEKILLENITIINKIKNRCLENGLVLTDENFDYIETIGLIATYPNIAKQLISKKRIDKEGLIFYDLENYINSHFYWGYLYEEDYYLMAHQYFRRNYYKSNNYGANFIWEFWSLKEKTIKSSIAIDFDRVCIKLNKIQELDVYYGPKFNKKILFNKKPITITKLKPSFEFKDNDYNIYSLDIKWKNNNGIRVFEAEEFKTKNIKIKIDGIDYHPVRYIHSEFDFNQDCFRHFDGAIHLYTEDEYLKRKDSDLNYNHKNNFKIKSKSLKMFKMNGKINVETWSKFTSYFFENNFLLYEYFEGKLPNDINNLKL